jgi:acetylornithine deacetylase/succinyl-diaminopimelate desuccinylase-like protein
LKRDIVFAAVPDEEAASKLGMEWLCEHRPEVVDVEFELSEGGGGQPDFAGREGRLFAVATNEKEMCWLRLTAVGTAGHGSRPHADNSAVHLMRALVRLADWDRGITFTPETRAYIERLVAGGLLRDGDEHATEAAIRENPGMLAMFMNTLNVTMLDAGIKPNVLPARASAVVDCRLLPGQSRHDWRREVIRVIDDPRIEVTFHEQTLEEPPVPTEWDTELYRVIESVVKEAYEDAVVVPTMTIGGTDNRFLRRRGVHAYGFIPCLLGPEERAGFHGNNEFLTVENLNMGVELMYEIVRRLCT